MSVVSTDVGASMEVAYGIFLANVHLSKALTSGAQALLLNHSLSGSCHSAQLWAPAGGALSTGFHAVWEQGQGGPHASLLCHLMTLDTLLPCRPPTPVNPLLSVFPVFRNLQMKSQQHPPILEASKYSFNC